MSDEMMQLIGIAVVTLAQVYVVQPWQFPVFAMFWDFIAVFAAKLSWALGWLSMNARENYYRAVSNVN